MDTITISLHIENAYEDGTEIVTTATDVVVPPFPTDEAEQDDWAYEYVYAQTGTGREDGDSWYDVTITASSDPTLVGRTFDFGY